MRDGGKRLVSLLAAAAVCLLAVTPASASGAGARRNPVTVSVGAEHQRFIYANHRDCEHLRRQRLEGRDPRGEQGPGIVAVLVRADGTMTRGMLVTVLVRYENVDTEGRAARYEKGTAWAMDKGLSGESRLDDSITREQRGLTLGVALPADRRLQSLCVTQKCSDYNLCRSGWEHRIGGRSGMNSRNAMMN